MIKKIVRAIFLTYPKLSFPLAAIIIFSVLLDLPMPLLTMYFIDHVLTGKNFNLLNVIGFILILFLVIKSAADFLRNYLNIKLYEKLIMSYGIKSYQNFIYSYYLAHISNPSGYWLSRIQNEPQALANIFKTVIDFLTNSITFFVGIFLIFYFSLTLGFLVLFIVPLYAWAMFKMGPKIKKGSILIKEERSKLTGFIEESLNGFEIIKILGIEQYRIGELKDYWNKLVNANLKMTILVSINGLLSILIVSLAPIGVLWYGGYLVMTGSMTLGTIIGINRFLSYVFSPISSFININTQVQDALTSMERLEELAKFNLESTGTRKVDIKTNESILITNLDFTYSSKKIFQNFDLTIKGGITTAFVGKSGCGKSTLSRIIIGLLKPDAGNVFIGNHDLKDLDLAYLRKQICLIPQNAYIFSGDIEYNIKLGEDVKNIDEVLYKITGVDKFINELTQNPESGLGSRGQKLSGGQRQRISLARALIREPKILIMDEVTSEIDLITEKEIIDTLIDIRKDKTTIIVAHGFASVKKADEIIVLSENGIEEIGTHEELINNKKIYSQFWETHIGETSIK
jgi:ABC-type bacteriocin/lantibiotic exporter with double-glycine peptidase domain